MFEDPKQITEAMKEGLARMYADPGMRDYIINAIRIANQNAMASLKKNQVDEAKVYSYRYETFKQLLEKGKENFVHFERVKEERNATNKKG